MLAIIYSEVHINSGQQPKSDLLVYKISVCSFCVLQVTYEETCTLSPIRSSLERT